MIETTTKTIKKSIYFEASGETLSVEDCLENVSPNMDIRNIVPFLDTLFKRVKEKLHFDYTGFN